MKSEVLGVKAPVKECTDSKCPFHGSIDVKPELFRGRVIKKDTNKSATIEWNRSYYVSKYERYEMRRSRLRVHNPPCIDAEIGQMVMAAKTRPLSKTKHHVIIQLLEKQIKVVKPAKETGKAAKKKAKVKENESTEE